MARMMMTPAAALPLRAVLADDERLPREQLRAALARVWPELQLVGEASHGAEALSLMERLQPDVAFLDIRMPEMSGLEVAHAVRALPLPCAVVFLTAFDEHALAAFDAQAVDYLLKPVDEQRLAQTAQRLRERHAQHQTATWDMARLQAALQPTPLPLATPALKWIQASVGSAVHFIAVDEVLWFHSDDKYTVVRTAQQEAVIRTPLKELAQQLNPDHFWPIHRNCIVAVGAIEKSERDAFGRTRLKVRGMEKWLEVSRSHALRFKGM